MTRVCRRTLDRNCALPDSESEIRQRIPTVTDFSQRKSDCLAAAEAAELQALCDLNPQATGYLRRICDALGGGLNPCRERGVTCSAFTRSGLALADGHLLQL